LVGRPTASSLSSPDDISRVRAVHDGVRHGFPRRLVHRGLPHPLALIRLPTPGEAHRRSVTPDLVEEDDPRLPQASPAGLFFIRSPDEGLLHICHPSIPFPSGSDVSFLIFLLWAASLHEPMTLICGGNPKTATSSLCWGMNQRPGTRPRPCLSLQGPPRPDPLRLGLPHRRWLDDWPNCYADNLIR
jgi:hypothetical protein